MLMVPFWGKTPSISIMGADTVLGMWTLSHTSKTFSKLGLQVSDGDRVFCSGCLPCLSSLLMGLLPTTMPEPKLSVLLGLHPSGDIWPTRREPAAGHLPVPTALWAKTSSLSAYIANIPHEGALCFFLTKHPFLRTKSPAYPTPAFLNEAVPSDSRGTFLLRDLPKHLGVLV